MQSSGLVHDVIVESLDDPPASSFGTTFCVPWPRGMVAPHKTTYRCQSTDGSDVDAQSTTSAYWPDGSVKWSSHSLSGTFGAQKTYRITASLQQENNNQSVNGPGLSIVEKDDCLDVHTGKIVVRFSRSGNFLIKTISMADTQNVVAEEGKLVLLSTSEISDPKEAGRTDRYHLDGLIESVQVESSGPVRAVIRAAGKHYSREPGKPHDYQRSSWLPFSIRFYLYANSEMIKLSHTLVYDGDPQRDIVCGLGLQFSIPLEKSNLYDRHIRFTSDKPGVFAEAVQGITGLRQDPGEAVRKAQIEGRALPPLKSWNQEVVQRLRWVPTWNDYSLSQLCPDGYTLRKRTAKGRAWINAPGGNRAGGLAYLGGAVTGGLVIGMKDFWERYPTGLEIRDTAKDTGKLTLWLYDPLAQPMTLGSYHDGLGQTTYEDQLDALKMTYEDWEPGFGTAYGIARTNEIFIFALGSTPSSNQLAQLTHYVRHPLIWVPSSEALLRTNVFGRIWTPFEQIRGDVQAMQLQHHLAFLFDFYKAQVAQRRWFGFWDHGDIMHTYDSDRHTWRYDIGGYAWDNSELSPDLWLWLYFLCSRRSDVFRFAYSLTRHTSEVDCYHVGRLKGLGTRHGVQHWSDSCKQLRVANASYRRIFFYLVGADERMGDLLSECLEGSNALLELDPYRKVRRPQNDTVTTDRSIEISLGTDWAALAAAWLVDYERSGEKSKSRDKLINLMRGVGSLRNGFATGYAALHVDTGVLSGGRESHTRVSHLSAMFGQVEVCAELIDLLDTETLAPGFACKWLEYCKYYNVTEQEQQAQYGASWGRLQLRQGHSRLTAYAAYKLDDRSLRDRAWLELCQGGECDGTDGFGPHTAWKTNAVSGCDILESSDEAVFVSTNAAALYGLAVIQVLTWARLSSSDNQLPAS